MQEIECIYSGPLKCNVPVDSTDEPINALVRVFSNGSLRLNCTNLDGEKCKITNQDCELLQNETDETEDPVEKGEIDIRKSLETILLIICQSPEQENILEFVEVATISTTLQVADGNKTEAARRLGISLRGLYRRLDKLGIK